MKHFVFGYPMLPTDLETLPTTPAVFTAIRVLDELAKTSGLTLSELSRRVEAPKASVYRVLNTLRRSRLVVQEGNEYRLGPKVLEYHAAYVRQFDITQFFYTVANRIVSTIDETVQLARLEGSEMVFIAKVDCGQMIRPATYVGRRVSAHATAVGKAMLSTLKNEQLRELYPQEDLPALTAHTITSVSALQRELELVRTRGYASTIQESTLNLCCLSAPIRDSSGSAVAALSICMATPKPTPNRREVALQHLIWGAREISIALGGSDTSDRSGVALAIGGSK
ncbi:MAG: IclR family transcriptional regulator [Thermaceae bacterium]|nr:IclR family transcriptional regulator [Thermaceae bacterium]